ncbi:MAG: AMP-binding protein [Sphingorhabdus sp.]
MSQSAAWTNDHRDSISAVFDRALARDPNQLFLDVGGETFTYQRFDFEVDRLASGLAELGISAGKTVATLLDNSALAVSALFAVTRLGAVSVPVNTAYKGEFLRHQLADSGAAVVICESDYAERVVAVEDSLPELQVLLYKDDLPACQPKRIAMQSIEKALRDTPVERANVSPSDLAMLIYTAGTTGPSKGCMVSHNYACNLARQLVEVNDITATDVLWTPLPMFHLNAISATILPAMMTGARMAIYKRFSVSNFWPEVKRTGATVVQLMGAMGPLLADAPDSDVMKRCFGQLRVAAAAPFPPALVDKWKTRFGVKHAGTVAFGLTECSIITSAKVADYRAPGSSGKRNDCFDVRIVDDNGNEVTPGVPGEIVVRPLKPDIMFQGYWRRPAETMALMKDLWFHTGDIGKFDDEGFFYFVDRKKDYIRRRGENISSFEMETAFRQHPAIEDVAVHAVHSEFTEDDVKVTVICKGDHRLTPKDLCLWSLDNIPYFAVPRYFEIRESLPRNPLGRVLKFELRSDGVTSATFDREVHDLQPVKR